MSVGGKKMGEQPDKRFKTAAEIKKEEQSRPKDPWSSSGTATGTQPQKQTAAALVPDDEEQATDTADEKPAAAKEKKAGRKSALATGDDSKEAEALQKQIEEVNRQMTKINEAANQLRMDLLKSTEALARETVATEVEILRHQHEQAQLSGDLSDLESKRDRLGSDTGELTKQVESLQTECDKMEKERDKLKGDSVRLRKLRQDYLAEIAKFKTDKSELLNA